MTIKEGAEAPKHDCIREIGHRIDAVNEKIRVLEVMGWGIEEEKLQRENEIYDVRMQIAKVLSERDALLNRKLKLEENTADSISSYDNR